MRRYTEATPCPASSTSFPQNRYHEYSQGTSIYLPNYMQDDTTTTTTTFDFTREVQPQITKVKPRRPRRDLRNSAFNPAMDIFEDVALEEEQKEQAVEVKRKSKASVLAKNVALKKSAIFAQPAQKMPIPTPPIQASQVPVQEGKVAKPTRRRVSQLLSDRHIVDTNATVRLQEVLLEKKERKERKTEVLKKDPRRRTIYVPSDDTTIITIHPGQSIHRTNNARVKEADFGLELVTLSEEEGKLVPALKQDKKAPRKSLAVPPKRGPLHQATCHSNVTFSEDVMGAGGGKENIPPGMSLYEGKCSKPEPEFYLTKDTVSINKSTTTKPTKVRFNTSKSVSVVGQSRTKAQADESRKRVKSQFSYDGSATKSLRGKADSNAASASRKTAARARISKTNPAPASSSPFHTDRSPPTALRRQRQRKEHAPAKISLLHVVGKPPQDQEKYPVLSEDLARPELYEDHWLTYQEIAITQLLNSLFDSATATANTNQESDELRKRMLALYHEPAIPALHKRLQASLKYGALSIPKDLLAQTLRLKDDVGLRRKFLTLWTGTYDLTCLRAAAEAIVGRQIPVSSRLSSGSTFSDDGNSRQFRAERRAIESFLDTFLIRNEDAVRVKNGIGSIGSIARGDHQSDDFGSQGWTWRRTVLRSLMLILLLDKAKAEDVLSGCLFQTSSPHKSSVEVLQFLANMLLPSMGDVTRPLGHLNYRVGHIQYPLQEYTYRIENLATDLRNGVILTRLAELLLYPPSTLVAQREETVTITMPTGDILTSTFDFQQKESWVLSQHLKFPAIGRPQKVYNVQIALSALAGVCNLPDAAATIHAEDIVDGHREKTLSLLWSLVGKWGLSSLVDWSLLAKEVERFRDQWYENRNEFEGADLDTEDEEETLELKGLQYHKHILLSWARCIARFNGICVKNLTTSFADGKALEAIVDAYLPPTLLGPDTVASDLGLAAKLKATGCSNSFIALFADRKSSTVPSRDFTLLSLSFLASRLLPLSVTHRAASIIQRAYRLLLARQTARKRVVLMRLAYECKTVVQTRERLVNAATVVQRRWKAVLGARNSQLNADVEMFQALARGWVIRRWVRRVTQGRIGGKEKVRRVRGGW
ncbi:hypothetical protein GQ43DRAFT_205431 [Delitschia confertaspora ATCC 74209]|uniref:Calponin-homology (CH) domain-containing protein n=1 Tax=Delitschia confertaspora ATCC 74209 TaxID=1513339 RepID=A0A9P4MUX3_9PLEO|nr:hypothetical protein GQ43DRAFT_205431 [Delitschia confertaspora ATCC 74209]